MYLSRCVDMNVCEHICVQVTECGSLCLTACEHVFVCD